MGGGSETWHIREVLSAGISGKVGLGEPLWLLISLILVSWGSVTGKRRRGKMGPLPRTWEGSNTRGTLPSSHCPPRTPSEWAVIQDFGQPFPNFPHFSYVIILFNIFVFFFEFSNQSFLHVLSTNSTPHFLDDQTFWCLLWIDRKISIWMSILSPLPP